MLLHRPTHSRQYGTPAPQAAAEQANPKLALAAPPRHTLLDHADPAKVPPGSSESKYRFCGVGLASTFFLSSFLKLNAYHTLISPPPFSFTCPPLDYPIISSLGLCIAHTLLGASDPPVATSLDCPRLIYPLVYPSPLSNLTAFRPAFQLWSPLQKCAPHSLLTILRLLPLKISAPAPPKARHLPYLLTGPEPLLLCLFQKVTIETMSLSEHQIRIVIALERTGASLSLVGVTLIFITYWLFKKLRTIPNLFIIFASIANVGASIACLIGQGGILMGEESALCQAQAFLLEMFMQSDPWWSLAMAINVFLVIFCGASPASFRRYLWLYCLICFGGPFIPAIILLLAQPNGQMMYGNATLWCWINNDWSALRIYTYYVPIWVCIFFSAVIYFAVGHHIFHQRNQLRNLTFTYPSKDGNDVLHLEGARDSSEMNLTTRVEDWQVTAVTEVRRTTAIPATCTRPQSPTVPLTAMTSPSQHRHVQHQRSWDGSEDDTEQRSSTTVNHARFETMISSNHPPPQSKPSMVARMRSRTASFNSSWLKGLDPIKFAYLRTSFIFAISILVTWTPSSINRVNGLINPNNSSYGLNIATAVVLPLQGVWNTAIYFMTSWSKVKEEYRALRARQSARRLDSRQGSGLGGARIEVLQGGQRDRSNMALFECNKRLGSDGTSELELMAPARISNNNIRVMPGLF
ncbi:Fc.00g056690.m01.CDS01 [Cosmosporella sp. VM-42]